MSFLFKGGNRLCVIQSNSIKNVFMKTGILIPFGNRCCRSHVDDIGLIKQSEIDNIIILCNTIEFDSEKLGNLFDSFRNHHLSTSTLLARFEDISIISNQICIDNTGFTQDEFCIILHQLQST